MNYKKALVRVSVFLALASALAAGSATNRGIVVLQPIEPPRLRFAVLVPEVTQTYTQRYHSHDTQAGLAQNILLAALRNAGYDVIALEPDGAGGGVDAARRRAAMQRADYLVYGQASAAQILSSQAVTLDSVRSATTIEAQIVDVKSGRIEYAENASSTGTARENVNQAAGALEDAARRLARKVLNDADDLAQRAADQAPQRVFTPPRRGSGADVR